jgi:molybdate transport system substrate-binding protein
MLRPFCAEIGICPTAARCSARAVTVVRAAAIFFLVAMLTHGDSANATEIKIFTSRAIATVLDEIGPEFEHTTGHKLNVISGFSNNFVKQIYAGDPFDVVVSPPRTIDPLIKDGKVIADTRTNLVRSGVGVEVRAGAPKPDISSVEAFKRALLNAKSVGYLSGAVPQLIDRLGIAEAIKSKMTIPDSDIVSELVAKGELELGVVVITQILTTPGVELVGPLPPEIQFYAVFTAGVSTNSKAPDAARELIKFLTGPTAMPVIKSQGMEPG